MQLVCFTIMWMVLQSVTVFMIGSYCYVIYGVYALIELKVFNKAQFSNNGDGCSFEMCFVATVLGPGEYKYPHAS